MNKSHKKCVEIGIETVMADVLLIPQLERRIKELEEVVFK